MQNRTDNQVPAGFFVRLAAYLLDSLIVGAALLLVRIPLWISSWVSPDNIIVRDFIFEYSVADILIYILGVLYFIILTYKTGTTVGKKVLNLRVVSVEERKMTLFEVAFRETVGRFLSALILNVGYIMIGVQKEKRGLHDLLSDTRVVYCHEKTVQIETPVVVKETAEAVEYAPAEYGQPEAVSQGMIETESSRPEADEQVTAETEGFQPEADEQDIATHEEVQETVEE